MGPVTMLTKQEAAEKIAEQITILNNALNEANRLAAEQGWDIYTDIEGEEDGEGPISETLRDLGRWSNSNC